MPYAHVISDLKIHRRQIFCHYTHQQNIKSELIAKQKTQMDSKIFLSSEVQGTACVLRYHQNLNCSMMSCITSCLVLRSIARQSIISCVNIL